MNLQENKMDELEINEVMSKKNVVMSRVGTKIKDGIDTGEVCVTVGVSQKISKDELTDEDLIPNVLSNGSITDVITYPTIYAKVGCDEDPKIKHRPIKGGISAIMEGSTACTLGLVVKDSLDKKLVALTNNHCAGIVYDPNYATPSAGNLNTNGNNNFQPSPNDGGTTSDVYGQVKRVVPIKFDSSTNTIDAAISTINAENPMTDILNVGDGPFEFEMNKNNYSGSINVFKNGRTTCYTSGIKSSSNVNINVIYIQPPYASNDIARYTNQIEIRGNQQFSDGGDSGSVIVANIDGKDKIIGLLFAGGQDGNEYVTIANHISDVASGINIEPWDGSIIVPYNTSGTITLNGKNYQRLEDTYEEITHIV